MVKAPWTIRACAQARGVFRVSTCVSFAETERETNGKGKRGEAKNGNVREEERHGAANLKFLENEAL